MKPLTPFSPELQLSQRGPIALCNAADLAAAARVPMQLRQRNPALIWVTALKKWLHSRQQN